MPLARRTSGRQALIGLAVVTSLAACTSTKRATQAPTSTSSTSTPAATGPVEALESAFESVVARVRPSVVEISTAQGLGSGIVYDAQGDIVTNNHVVGSSTTFMVTFGDGRTSGATLVGGYPPDDLAVIKVDGTANLPPAAMFADSTAVKVGQIAFAIGNPLGLASSVTEGIVSFNGRNVSEGGGVVLASTIQTSAAINPGNSGGALVDLRGAVIGIPTLAASDPQLGGGAAPGIGFAIPSNTVKLIADQLVKSGKVTNSGRAALGIAATDVVTASGNQGGVLVRQVQSGSPADKAGIVAGDVITSIAGSPTPNLPALADLLASHRPSDTVKVDVTRADGTKQTFDVMLGTLPG